MSDPVNTQQSLVELMRADSSGSWVRVWLDVGNVEAIAANPALGSSMGSSVNWENIQVTDCCAIALDLAGRVAHRYNL
ncbi:hypothetical protein AB0C34_09130 [Nocardia sp. NPDC049220]|uniref:hypothetical protein n=1 Tax=Nocardia sp. NPDC049220 TaxID=3155273 RepID=UPI0033D825C7